MNKNTIKDQADKMKKRRKKDLVNRLGNEIQNKSGGILTKKDVKQFFENAAKK